MNQREQLIEKVRAIRDDAYLSATYLANEHVGDLMSEILAVLDEAANVLDHSELLANVASSADEREALIAFLLKSRVWNVADRADEILRMLHRTVQGESFDEGTLVKVYDALIATFPEKAEWEIREAVSALQNAGILFQERTVQGATEAPNSESFSSVRGEPSHEGHEGHEFCDPRLGCVQGELSRDREAQALQEAELYVEHTAPSQRAEAMDDFMTGWRTADRTLRQGEPSVQEWSERAHAARNRAIAKGYTPEHDAEHGIRHLLDWAIDYARRGRAEESSGLILSAIALLDAPQCEPTDAQVLAAQSALLSDIGWVRYSYVRNALRAAAQAHQEG